MTSTEPNILWFTVRQHHRRRINTEEKAKVVVAAWGTQLNAALTIQQQGWFEEFVWGEHSFCRVVVWWNVNRMIIHFFQSIQSAMRPLFYWCFSSIPLGVKLHVWQGIETIPSPNKQRRPLPSPLYLSFACIYNCSRDSLVLLQCAWAENITSAHAPRRCQLPAP